MKESLESIINDFAQNLTVSEYNQYIPKLKDYFIPYLLNKSNDYDIDRLFKDEFTRSDIVNATIYYIVNNPNVECISAINDFLVALNILFNELLFERYPNPTLQKYKSFTIFYTEIKQRLKEKGIELKGKDVYPEIDKEQFRFIIEYLDSSQDKNTKFSIAKIVIRLMLLYGFSHDLISNLQVGNYRIKERLLIIKYEKNPEIRIELEVPYKLAKELEEYIESRGKVEKEEYLFVNQNNNQIDNGFIKPVLNNIKKEYQKIKRIEHHNSKNKFTPTGLQKYAIIQLISEGMNQSIIMELTWQKEDIYNYCQSYVNDIKKVTRNRYVNHIVRGIATYDEL